MNNIQKMFNQVNAIISFLPENERNILPKEMINFFNKKADCPPEEALDLAKPLEEQDLTDETIFMLYNINNLLKEKNKGL